MSEWSVLVRQMQGLPFCCSYARGFQVLVCSSQHNCHGDFLLDRSFIAHSLPDKRDQSLRESKSALAKWQLCYLISPLGICPHMSYDCHYSWSCIDGMSFAATPSMILPMSISNLSLNSLEVFHAVNHHSVRLLALMKRCQPSFFYGSSGDQISSSCSMSQEAAVNGFPQKRWPWICSTVIRVHPRTVFPLLS